jgi:hypothetical protein
MEDIEPINPRRRAERYGPFRASGAAWMLECRDLRDSEGEDGGAADALPTGPWGRPSIRPR